MPCKAICLTICSLLAALPAEALTMCGAAQQGGIIRLQDENLAEVKLNGKTYNADKNGELAIAFGRDAELQQPLKIFYKKGVGTVSPCRRCPADKPQTTKRLKPPVWD